MAQSGPLGLIEKIILLSLAPECPRAVHFTLLESIIKYQFTRVIFGVSPSQFLLNGIVQTHANKYENIDPEFARKVKKHFYVDDLNSLNSGAQSTK